MVKFSGLRKTLKTLKNYTYTKPKQKLQYARNKSTNLFLKTLKNKSRKKFLNFVSGRSKWYWKGLSEKEKKDIRRNLMKTQRILKTLRKKSKGSTLTRTNDRLLNMYNQKIKTLKGQLSARLAPTTKALEERYNIQKYFNQYRDENPVNEPDFFEKDEGVIMLTKDTRYPLDKKALKIPDSNIPEPPLLHKDELLYTIGKRTLPKASQGEIQYMIIPKLFAEWKQDIDPATQQLRVYPYVDDIPDDEFAEFVEAMRNLDTDSDVEVGSLFQGRTVADMDKWVHEEEEGTVGNPKIFISRFKSPNGKKYIFREMFGDTGAGYFNRLIGWIRQGKEKILLAKVFDTATCISVKDPDIPNFKSADYRFHPLTTLKTNGCIVIFDGMDFFKSMNPAGTKGFLNKNFIIFAQGYFPIRTQIIHIMGKYFQTSSFIQKAFDNWGIEGIDALLLELFQVKYPQLSIKISTLILGTDNFFYMLKRLKIQDNFILINGYWDTSFTAVNPFSTLSKYLPVIQTAIQEGNLYGLSPYIAYFMKKTVPDMWLEAFNTAESNENVRIYDTLDPYKKITIDYLQYLRFIHTLETTNYNFQAAKESYNEYLGDKTNEILNIFMNAYDKHSKELLFLQNVVSTNIPPQIPMIKTQAQIQNLLDLFTNA